MARNILKDQQLREERTTQILVSAVRIFARRGLLATISEIADDAGLSPGHIYNYFDSKEQILLKIIEKGQDIHTEMFAEALNRDGDALTKLRFIKQFYLSKERTSEGYLIMLQALATDLLSEADKDLIKQTSRHNLVQLKSIFEQGQREGIIVQGDPLKLATLFTINVQNLLLNEIRGFEQVDEATLELVLQLFTAK